MNPVSDSEQFLRTDDRHQSAKSTAILFAKAGRRKPTPQAVQFFGCQSSRSIPPFILGWPLICGWHGRLVDHVRKKLHRNWEYWELSCTGGVASLSETEVCYINNTSVFWWTKWAPSGGLPLGPMSGNCTCFNPSDFSWLPVHLGTLVTSKIHKDLGVPIFIDHIRSLSKRYEPKLADVGNPLVRQLGRYLR